MKKEINLTMQDFINGIKKLGTTEWVTIFDFPDSRRTTGTYFCALIHNDKVGDILENYAWDLRIWANRPGFMTYSKDGKTITEYYRFSEQGIEPLVYWRSFNGKKEAYLEVSEEFRLYFNLFEVAENNNKTFIYTNDDGDEDEVIKISKNKVEVRLKYIKEYLSARQMHLAIYYEVLRLSDKTLKDLKLQEVDEIKKGDDYIYSLIVRNFNIDDKKSQGLLLGKKLIAGLKDFKPDNWDDRTDEKFEDFIIGVDENGKEVVHSCNTDYKESPGFLTPVFFRREVLKKYYDSPDKYSVEDGHVKFDGFWGVRVLNNHTDHVVVWLGDLKSLPYKEQTHWRAFNTTPSSKKISRTDFTRNIEGNFADPEHPELYFKYKFKLFQDAWNEQFGWYLFEPLSTEDNHHMKSLHVPTTKEQKEFDDQVASITKIMIDSLNEKELEKGFENKKIIGGIAKLEAFLNANNFHSPKTIEFFRNLQSLRSSGVAHRKGIKYNKMKKIFNIDNRDFSLVFEDILVKCIYVFNTLENYFIKQN
ncbi:MAG: hypothetical protein WC472_01695 [Candidatus Paceibacterota bacterium]